MALWRKVIQHFVRWHMAEKKGQIWLHFEDGGVKKKLDVDSVEEMALLTEMLNSGKSLAYSEKFGFISSASMDESKGTEEID